VALVPAGCVFYLQKFELNFCAFSDFGISSECLELWRSDRCMSESGGGVRRLPWTGQCKCAAAAFNSWSVLLRLKGSCASCAMATEVSHGVSGPQEKASGLFRTQPRTCLSILASGNVSVLCPEEGVE